MLKVQSTKFIPNIRKILCKFFFLVPVIFLSLLIHIFKFSIFLWLKYISHHLIRYPKSLSFILVYIFQSENLSNDDFRVALQMLYTDSIGFQQLNISWSSRSITYTYMVFILQDPHVKVHLLFIFNKLLSCIFIETRILLKIEQNTYIQI